MELTDVIAFTRKEASSLEHVANTISSLKRSITPIILGTSELSYERVFGWLERNKPTMLIPSKRQYDELVSCAEGIDELIADGSRTALETAKTHLDRLKYFANRLANTLRDTAEDLMSDEQIINLISNIRIEDIDTLSGLFHKLQELPKSRPMPQNNKLWSQADEKVLKKVYEAGKKGTLSDKGEEDLWEMRELRELHYSLTHEYSSIGSNMEGKSLDEMAEIMVKEGKAKNPLEAMLQLASEAEQNALIERRLWRLAEKEYRKIDTDYDQALSIIEKEATDIIEQIEKSLCSNESLVKLDRMLEEKLLTNFQQMQSYNFSDILLQSQAQNLVKGSIDALEAIKSNIGHQQQAPDRPQKPTEDSVGQLFKYIDTVLYDIRQLEDCRSRNPYVDKRIRTELAVAYNETKKRLEKILAERPEIKDAPAETDDSEKYLRNAHTWCVGRLSWEDGERIGAEKTADKLVEKPAGTEQSEALVSCITIGDIEELLELFRQLDNLIEPALPPKDDSMWCEAKKEAQEELSEQLKERRSTFSERPGLNVPPRKATRMEQRKYQQQVENRILAIAEKKYCERDQAYSKAVDTAKRTAADVLKKIDHLLACTGGVLQRFRRTKETWLVENFKEIRKLYDLMVKDSIKYSVRETIDALEALKLKYERQERLDTQKEHKVHPCKKNTKATVIAISISLFIICTFELCVHLIPFPWLKNHPNSYGLQGGIILLAPCLVVGWFKPQWRKWFWRGAALAIIVLILSLLGGPGKE